MSNYNDLLYTNKFQSTSTLTKEQISNSRNNLRDVNNYIKNSSRPVNKLLNNNLLSSDTINIKKFKGSPFPSAFNKNSYPIMSDAMKDIAEDKYSKIRKTSISINSEDRNKSFFVLPNNYDIDLENKFENIQKIVLKDIQIPNSIPAINQDNNVFCWGYPTKKELIETGSDNVLIPTKNNTIYFSDVADVNVCDFKELIYLSIFPESFINLTDFPEFFKDYIRRNNLHGIKNLTDPDYIKLKDPTQNTGDNAEPFVDLTRKFIEKPYGIVEVGKNTIFNMNIDIMSGLVSIVNQIEEVNVLCAQTFTSDTVVSDDTIFGDTTYTKTSYVGVSDLLTDRVYITVSFTEDIFENFHNSINPYPLVFLNLSKIGGITESEINYTPFFQEQIYVDNYSGNIPKYVSTYRLFDKIEIPTSGTAPNIFLLRFELKISSGNTNPEFFNTSGTVIRVNSTENIIYNQSLVDILAGNSEKGPFSNYSGNLTFDDNKISRVGRALPIRIYRNLSKLSKDDYCAPNNLTLLSLLGFPTESNEEYAELISLTSTYKFIHTNSQDFLVSPYLANVDKVSLFNNIIKNKSIQNKLNLENYNGEYYFKSVPFLFMKLLPNKIENENYGENLIRASDTNNKFLEEEYDKVFFSTEAGKKEKRNTNNLFAKIYLKQYPYGTNEINGKEYELFFEDQPLENLTSFKIVFTDPFGRILNLNLPHTFTIDIYEKINVLKDTLIDTRNGDVVTNGIKSIYN